MVQKTDETELLMVGSCSSTLRFRDVVIKTPRVDEEAEITQENAKATRIEANVYSILGEHERVARCLYISPTRDMVMLEFYPNGNLKGYAAARATPPYHLRKWARQMIEGVGYVHSKGVRHSDLRLDQWLLDSETNARLSDFNASGYDECSRLDLPGEKALGIEGPSHFLPRDPCADNSVRSDLFALGSALYELEHGSAPYAGVDDEAIAKRYELQCFPSVSTMMLGQVISGAWAGRFASAAEMLEEGEQTCGLRNTSIDWLRG